MGPVHYFPGAGVNVRVDQVGREMATQIAKEESKHPKRHRVTVRVLGFIIPHLHLYLHLPSPVWCTVDR